MKRNKIIAIALAFAVFATSCACFAFAKGGPAGGKNSEGPAPNNLAAINVDGLKKGEIPLAETIKNDAGQTILQYFDGTYRYYVVEADGELTMASMDADSEMAKKLREGYFSGNAAPISTEEANRIFYAAIEKIFPEYDLKRVSHTLTDDTGLYGEHFRYLAEEKTGDARINIAAVNLAYDGQITYFFGTHNTLGMFSTKSSFKKSELIDISLKYLLSNKNAFEKQLAPNFDNEAKLSEPIVATEGMALPDGVKIGDTFTIGILPEYKIFVSSAKDIYNPKAIKEFYEGKLVWNVDFFIKTSWGAIDAIFNPLVSLKIDAETGEVIGMVSTDGGELK